MSKKENKASQLLNRLQTLTESELDQLAPLIHEITQRGNRTRAARIRGIISSLAGFSESKIDWLNLIVERFELVHAYRQFRGDLITHKILESFGDALLVHHCLSKESLSKDRFEYMLERAVNSSGQRAAIAPRGNPGHDITINGEKFSLKTQADASLKLDSIHISKFMELGSGEWSNNPMHLIGLRNQFLDHLKEYERILILRTLRKPPEPWLYELVEIPKKLLLGAKDGELEMRMESGQNPKPGYCRVYSKDRELQFELYFDGGGERKLQVKNLRKDLCVVHSTWEIKSSQDLL